MEFIFRMKEALRVPMIVRGLPYDRIVSPIEIDQNSDVMLISSSNNALVNHISATTIGMMGSDTIGFFDQFTLNEIAEE